MTGNKLGEIERLGMIAEQIQDTMDTIELQYWDHPGVGEASKLDEHVWSAWVAMRHLKDDILAERIQELEEIEYEAMIHDDRRIDEQRRIAEIRGI